MPTLLIIRPTECLPPVGRCARLDDVTVDGGPSPAQASKNWRSMSACQCWKPPLPPRAALTTLPQPQKHQSVGRDAPVSAPTRLAAEEKLSEDVSVVEFGQLEA